MAAKDAQPGQMKEYMIRMLYVEASPMAVLALPVNRASSQMLGHDASFGHINAVQVGFLVAPPHFRGCSMPPVLGRLSIAVICFRSVLPTSPHPWCSLRFAVMAVTRCGGIVLFVLVSVHEYKSDFCTMRPPQPVSILGNSWLVNKLPRDCAYARSQRANRLYTRITSSCC